MLHKIPSPFRLSAGDDPAAGFPAAGTHVDDVVRAANHVQVMLDHNYRGAVVNQGLEYGQQYLHIRADDSRAVAARAEGRFLRVVCVNRIVLHL